ncbi:hypothetical protein ABEO75_28225 [Paenibacillus macerans]|uniref:hypothetical protein n=1 Tax=Paenibacillus macerans TaxID=44252 RepID=UPI002E1B3828|nr:hypothetical protein [Paenibacillus macerans]
MIAVKNTPIYPVLRQHRQIAVQKGVIFGESGQNGRLQPEQKKIAPHFTAILRILLNRGRIAAFYTVIAIIKRNLRRTATCHHRQFPRRRIW